MSLRSFLPSTRQFSHLTYNLRTMSSSSAITPTPERAQELNENIQSVLNDVNAAAGQRAVRLVPISKLKPSSDIMALYQAGHRHFGENYIQELSDKAKELPSDIKWHFVGNLQSNKTKLATAIPNLYLLETLDSVKKADLIEKQLASDSTPTRSEPLNVYIQINTSLEENKSGLPPLPPSESTPDASESALDLAHHIVTSCPNLRLLGLMTIGSFDNSHRHGEEGNPDFKRLVQTRKELVKGLEDKGIKGEQYGAEGGKLELSMGMSADFEDALKSGSDSVRVGTRIFGERPPKH